METFFDAEEDPATPRRNRAPLPGPPANSQFRASLSVSEDDSLLRDETQQAPVNEHISRSPSKLAKVKHLKQKSKSKAKELLGLKSAEESESDASAGARIIVKVEEDPAFNPAPLLDHGPPDTKQKASDDLKDTAKDLFHSTSHPVTATKEAVKRKAAREIARAQRPFISAADDHEFLAAHEELARASSQSAATSASNSDEEALEERRRKIEHLEAHRESLRIAWAIGRHVDRVRIVDPNNITFPHKADFIERDEEGKENRFRWEQYLGHLLVYISRNFTAQYIDDSDELPFDIDTLSRTVERLIMASGPWQAYFMDLRSIYRWENPRRTGFWFVVWVILWKTQHMAGFVYIYVVYILMKEWYYPSSISQLRSSLDRALDRTQSAQAWGELVDKHGRNDWIEPLLEEFGPFIQVQLSDLADFLEVLLNLYRWTRPTKTAGTVFFYFSCFLVTVFADMEYCMRIVYFICLGSFFLCWPVSSGWPKYRYLMDPFKWIYWDIPTHAEASLWDIQKRAILLQMEADERSVCAQAVDGQMNGESNAEVRAVSHFGDDDTAKMTSAAEVFKFRVYSHGASGRLILGRTGITFTKTRREAWSISYARLVEMRKDVAAITSKTKSLARAGFRLVLLYHDEEGNVCERHIDADQGKREEIFSIILGWSGLHWKAVRAPSRKKGSKSKL